MALSNGGSCGRGHSLLRAGRDRRPTRSLARGFPRGGCRCDRTELSLGSYFAIHTTSRRFLWSIDDFVYLSAFLLSFWPALSASTS